MTCALWIRIGAAFCFIAAAATQQPESQQVPKFEVASIRPVPPDAPPFLQPQGFTGVFPGGKFIHPRAYLPYLITLAYDVQWPHQRQLVGLPDWAKKTRFSISAVPEQDFPSLSAAENEKRVFLMIRALLEERFRLQFHIETRQEEVLFLEVAKDGFRFKDVSPLLPTEKEGQVGAAIGDDGGRISGNRSTISGLVKTLSVFFDRPLMDRTGLKGYYDFRVSWTAPKSLDGQPPAPSLGAEGFALLITALRDQFGLQVRKATGPVKFWVVDHIEPPTGND